jgi:hypothetical protein
VPDDLDDMVCLPMQDCYGCNVRGQQAPGLYFGKASAKR